ncbi:MAG: hypothetical protein DLM67_13910 [Candidatus Nephthysia bennettiae]|uniref:DUF1116 domain-containing protein n=1 Tax=Candidatus Nephthysia bennettiae TaxID=3127016 RepID=A0A934K858_9BACT|nr:DUF1116 domain-containing protein [Candidatus Dormibacteraeota bacterium]MBJ7615038.1 DUF1116 domain-containing protein [Candidatus Dormibacteraeota bacterium]PZR93253.1 MAG: hypothetical protein DLM67_13910 [Candidatus Dormibacteraeota bacterium]
MSLLSAPVRVVSAGAAMLADVLEAEQVRVDWRPPLERLEPDGEVDAANQEAVAHMLAARPHWVGVGVARDVIPGMRDDLLLHSGPPLSWEAASGPMRGALEGALRLEGRSSADLEPCHQHMAVGPMAGVISAGMPVVVVEDRTSGVRAYSNLNEGLGRVLRYGANDADVLDRLRWMGNVLGPDLKAALEQGPIDLGGINQKALQMGDELHNRHRAATSMLFRGLALRGLSRESLAFIDQNDYFYLNLAMAAAKAACEAAAGVARSTLVVAMARNGTEFGVRVSGSPELWFTAPAAVPVGLFLGSYEQEDANPDIGDSAITETYGLGGFAMAAAPAITRVVGGSAQSALEATREMYEITLAESPIHLVPGLDFRGTPTGIDVRRVVETGIQPLINTGIAHREPGIGQIGAGLVRAPLEPFLAAHRHLSPPPVGGVPGVAGGGGSRPSGE